ncbi:MAG: motility protein A [Ruminococcus sp.]|nr:motility protein A [Ruminococcus sp.]
MDLLSIIGFIMAIALIIISILMGEDPDTGRTTLIVEQLKGFIDVGSIAIVFGGTIGAMMVSYPASMFKQMLKHLKIIFFPTKYNPLECIEHITSFATEARINGLLALEEKMNEIKDPFMKNALMLVVDSVEPEKVKMLLENELDYLEERHAQSQSFYMKMSEYAPAFGMAGTLIGLINLLANMQDADALAANMAVALVTTFYGVLIANLFAKPVASKLKKRHEEEYLYKMIISEGVKSIQDGDNPRFIEEKLMRLLPSSMNTLNGNGKNKKG